MHTPNQVGNLKYGKRIQQVIKLYSVIGFAKLESSVDG